MNSKQSKHEEFSNKRDRHLYGPLYKGIITLKQPRDGHLYGPHYKGIITLKQPQNALFNRLQKLGFHVTKPKFIFIIECDSVVVGSGYGGGVIVGVLANAGLKVLVLEKGSYLARTNLSLLEGPSMDQIFLGNGQMMSKDMDVFLLSGSTVGGGSTINWSASIDTPSHVLKERCEIYELEMFQSEFYKEAREVVLKIQILVKTYMSIRLYLRGTLFRYVKNFEVWPESDKRSYEGGIMSVMSKVIASFEESGYGAVIQTPALHPGMFSVVMAWISGLDIKMRMCKYSRTAHIFALARDKDSGEAISPYSISYNLDQIDEQNLKVGIELLLRILAAAGAEEIGTHHVKGKKLKVKESTVQAISYCTAQNVLQVLKSKKTN